ncbi:class B sortase, LPKTxAVK-specific [Streptococcus danieliae]|uniref:class B sortase, LPKTxAVK-specific n=1 Tax=Streptococcus danieliae TaxID=747656 RepID=UPI0021C9C258|nr:class B sortase, LPKTxAVK-specific [Streptococcus danieliae]MCU0082938.1 class B sortase, LPKTxAVK-specific [Streptococcus danieliae]
MKLENRFIKTFLTGFVLLSGLILMLVGCSSSSKANQNSPQPQNKQTRTYQPSAEDKVYLKERFEPLLATNKDTIAYVYAPGTNLDEPVVQTTDNATYLDKTFTGGHEPYMGTVFMDMDNSKDFSDRLTWLFGHARGSKVPDSRMFNDVNFYSNSDYFSQHPYVVVETPERKYYYEAVAMIIVPETTAFYRTEFDSDQDFVEQLNQVYKDAQVKKKDVEIKAEDRYLVLSTCREEDETIRANLYLRQIPDSEMEAFVKEHGEKLAYKSTRD